ncbi:MAG: hypothetical protein ACHQJD_04830 [Thermoanaerobaculia bacterium]
MVLLGFDPGGIKSFGWATLEVGDDDAVISLKTGVTSTAPEAVCEAGQRATSAPAGVGIDAPLFWVQQGDRHADFQIRQRVIAAGGQSGTVSHVNSLQGACLVQGILAARLVAASWPSAIVTEAHPKALLRLYADAKHFVAAHISSDRKEHERDAALAAFAAWAAVIANPTWRNLVFERN